MGELVNCPRCGKLFVRGIRNLCNVCYEEEEEIFQTVYRFISTRENRRATMMEVCQATCVKEKTITRFIREGRLRLADFPNLGYPCESCGSIIRKGKLCGDCQEKLRKSLELHECEREFQQRKEKKDQAHTYYYSAKPED